MSKVGVVIPVYNSEKYLDRCFQSLENQTLKDFEVVAVDDGSTDHSLDKLYEIKDKYNLNMRIIHQENKGANFARKTGIDKIDSKYLSFIDSDDYVDKKYLEQLKMTMEQTKTNMCCSRLAMHFDTPILKNIPLKSRKIKLQKVDLLKQKEYLPLINVVTTCKMFDRDYVKITDHKFKANEDLSINFLSYVLARYVSFSNTSYHYVSNQDGLASCNLAGYTYDNILNTLDPLSELKNNFEKYNLDSTYHDELESIFLINLFQRINSVAALEKDESKKKQIIECLIEYLEIYYPNWRENKYLCNNFMTFELPYIKDCLSAKKLLKNITTDQSIDTIEKVKEKYKRLAK